VGGREERRDILNELSTFWPTLCSSSMPLLALEEENSTFKLQNDPKKTQFLSADIGKRTCFRRPYFPLSLP
jgi:hypothetical protein